MHHLLAVSPSWLGLFHFFLLFHSLRCCHGGAFSDSSVQLTNQNVLDKSFSHDISCRFTGCERRASTLSVASCSKEAQTHLRPLPELTVHDPDPVRCSEKHVFFTSVQPDPVNSRLRHVTEVHLQK